MTCDRYPRQRTLSKLVAVNCCNNRTLTMSSNAFCPNPKISVITYGNAHKMSHCLRMSMLSWNKTLYLKCYSLTFIDWVFIIFSIDICLLSSYSIFVTLHIVSCAFTYLLLHLLVSEPPVYAVLEAAFMTVSIWNLREMADSLQGWKKPRFLKKFF